MKAHRSQSIVSGILGIVAIIIFMVGRFQAAVIIMLWGIMAGVAAIYFRLGDE